MKTISAGRGQYANSPFLKFSGAISTDSGQESETEFAEGCIRIRKRKAKAVAGQAIGTPR